MVKWGFFRPGSGIGRYSRSYFYASKQKRLLRIVGQGGTLWLVTSRRLKGQLRNYHLAYKLVDCTATQPTEEIAKEFGPYMVSARNWQRSIHFPYNNATEMLLRLKFLSGQPLMDKSKIGLRFLTIPQLTEDSTAELEAFQQKTLSERTTFLSYSHKDLQIANMLEHSLEERNVHVWRDETSLHAGEKWEETLNKVARSADCVIVLVSPSAAASNYVKKEVEWATGSKLVETIIPLAIPGGNRNDFPQLSPYQWVDYPQQPDSSFFDKLAANISKISRKRITE